jgi:hypothetical protein
MSSPAAFQSSVALQQGFGVPGDIFQDVAWVVQSYTIVSDPQVNTVGSTAYTITSQGLAEAGSGGSLGFAGILCAPKSYSLFGTGGVPLQPTLVLPDETQAELLTQGMMIAKLPGAASIGDYVLYDNTTGVLETTAPTDTLPTGKSFANAVVALFDVSDNGIAVIQVTPVINPIPVLAP